MAGGYDLFTAVPEPRIPISLFGDAATQGIAAGNALPTETTAAIRGAIQGVQQGQQIQSNQLSIERQQQENEIRANQIEQLPVQNEMDQVQLENARKVNELNQIKLEMDRANKQDLLDAELARAQYQKQTYDQKKALDEKAAKLQSQYAQADPLEQKQMLFSGEYDDVYAAEPRLYDQHLSKVYGSLNDSEKQSALLASGKLNIDRRYKDSLDKYSQALKKSQVELENDPAVIEAANATNKNYEDIVDDIVPVPSGKYVTNDDGTIQFGKDGKLLQSPNFVPGSDSKIDFRVGNKIVVKGVDRKSYDKITNYKFNRSNVDGTIRDEQIRDLERTYGATKESQEPAQPKQDTFIINKAAPAQIPQDGRVRHNPAAIMDVPNISFKGDINVSTKPQAYEITRNYLGLDERDFAQIKPQVKDLLNVIDVGPKGWFGHYDTTQLKVKDAAEDKIAKFVSEKEWDTNPEVQAQYTQNMVRDHNRVVAEWKEAMKNPTWVMGRGIATPEALDMQLTYETLTPVQSPKELYVLRNSGVVKDNLSKLSARLEEELRKNKQAEVRLNTGVRDALKAKDLGRPNAAAQ